MSQIENGSAAETASSSEDGWEVAGDVVCLAESLVVSPDRGHFRREHLEEGATVEVGTVIGAMTIGRDRAVPVTSRVAGVFLGWLAWDGENVERGAPLAHIGVNGHAGNGSKPGTNGSARP